MADYDSDYVEEEEKIADINVTQAPAPAKKSKIHACCREAIDTQTGKHKLQCTYCPNSYSYKGGNTSSMIQDLRASHRDNPDVVRDFPETPGKTPSKVQEKRSLAQASIVEGIDQMKPMHPSNRVAMKITDCLIVQAAIRYLWDPIIDESPPCLGHTVQLVVNDSVDSQRAERSGGYFSTNTASKCRAKVGFRVSNAGEACKAQTVYSRPG